MALAKIAGVKAYTSKGKVYAYHRATGEKLTAPYGSAEFFRQVADAEKKYRATLEAADAIMPGTWGALVREYRGSPKFRDELAPRTRSDYNKVFDWLAMLDAMPLADWSRGFVVQLRDKAQKKKKRRFANYVLSVVSAVFSWGFERELVDVHPAQKIKKIRRPRGMVRANRPWTKAEWDVVTAAAMPHLLAPILLAGVLGWREGEVVMRPRSDYDREARTIRRVSAKSGKLVKTPVPAQLATALSALTPHAATTLLISSKGRPWTLNGFASSFFKFIGDLEKLGVVDEGLTFHGLRHTMATRARELGFDKDTIADLLGQSEAGMAEWYARDAALEGKLEGVVNEIERRTTDAT